MYSEEEIPTPSCNRLLSCISDEEYARLLPHLHPVMSRLGQVISDGEVRLQYAYFPVSCIVSLVSRLEDGASAEIALIGKDGVLGTSLFLGGNHTINGAVVCLEGYAYRMDGRILRDEFSRGGSFQRTLLRYTDTLMAQMCLTAACNYNHTLEKRFCRWLLLMHDRASSDELIMTQEFIAHLLGGRRETVTAAAGNLQDAGIIHCSRGRITISNRAGLEKTVCECYRAVNNEGTRIFSPVRIHPHEVAVEPLSRSRASNSLS